LAWALLVIAAVFVMLALLRVAAAERALLMRQWPSLLLGLAAGFLLWRGLWGFAAVLGGLAWLAWIWPKRARPQTPATEDQADRDARSILGVGVNASADEIRAAYRNRMRSAHPDQGGSQALAAKLAAARDLLLKKRR
jgi:hypothetical protein